MTVTDWTSSRRLAQLYAATIGACLGVSIVCAAICRIAQLSPDSLWLSTQVFGQVFGLHQVLLYNFVLLPVIPSVFGYAWLTQAWRRNTTGASPLPRGEDHQALALPRVALLSWLCLLGGVLLVLQALATSGIETGWAYAVASPSTRDLPSQTFLAGIALAYLSVLLTGIVLIVTIARGRGVKDSLFGRALYCASWLVVASSVVALATLAMASLEKIVPLPMFSVDLGGDPSLLATIFAWTSTPTTTAILLAVVGLAAAVLRLEGHLSDASLASARRLFVWTTLFSFGALDTRVLPATLSPERVLASFLMKALCTTTLVALAFIVVRAAARERAWAEPGRLAATSALIVLVLIAPLDLLLSAPGAGLFAIGYLGQGASYLLVGGSTVLAVLGGASHLVGKAAPGEPGRATALGGTAAVLAGLVLTVVPMFGMGFSGARMDMPIYPRELVPLQTIIFFGGAILTVSLIVSGLELALRGSLRHGR